MSYAKAVVLYKTIHEVYERIVRVKISECRRGSVALLWATLVEMMGDLLDLLQETEKNRSLDIYDAIAATPAFMLGNPCVEAIYNKMREMVLIVAYEHVLEDAIKFDELPSIHQLDNDVRESPMAYVIGKRSIQKITHKHGDKARGEKHSRTFYRCLRDLAKQCEYRRFIMLIRKWHQCGYTLKPCAADDLVKILTASARIEGTHAYASNDCAVCVKMMRSALASQTPQGICAEFEKCFGDECTRDLMIGAMPDLPATLNAEQTTLLHKILHNGGDSGFPVSVLSAFFQLSDYEGDIDDEEKVWRAEQWRAGWIAG